MLLRCVFLVACVGLASAVDCGQKSAKYPDSIKTSGGKITGAKQGIVNGDAANPHSWPWHVFLSSKHGYIWNECGASILNEKWVVTAAHCVDDKGTDDPTDAAWLEEQRQAIKFIIAGMHNMKTIDTGATPEQQRCLAAKLILHPKWAGRKATAKGTPMDNDIALIKLDCTLKWTDAVKPICLPSKSDSFYTKGENVVLTGWGKLSNNGGQPDYLQQVVVEVEGESKYHQNGHVFDVAKGAFGACKGDSGGPANAMRNNKWVLAGVTSYTSAGSDVKYCDSKDSTNGYTHVPHYVDWINQHISDMS